MKSFKKHIVKLAAYALLVANLFQLTACLSSEETTVNSDSQQAKQTTSIESNESENIDNMEAKKQDFPIPIHGWETYRQLEQFSRIDTGVKTLQFSSFDRTGGNTKDGFDGTYSYLRREGSSYVIAEAKGSGEIQSIWFTRDGGNVSKTGKIMIELDGELVVDTSLQGLVNGDLGAPFVYPFVANAKQTSGGVTIKVPMPYKKSMRILTSSNPQFYHVSYRVFNSDQGIETFDPNYIPEDVMEMSKKWGHEDPKAQVENAQPFDHEFSLKAGEEIELASFEGSGQLTSLAFQLSDLVGAPPAEVVIDDGRAHVGTSQFDAKIDPNNEGIVLIRRYDSISTNQTANIYIDDELASKWTGQGIVPGGWVEEEIEIDASFTSGKDSIRIKNEFISAGMDFSEFRFFVDSIVDGKRVRTDEIDVGPFVGAQKSEADHNYQVTKQNWEGDRTYILPSDIEDETDILRTDKLLEGLRLEIMVDDEVRVDSPFGIFFGSGLGHYEVHALMYQITEEGKYEAWWPMPFAKKITVKLRNESEVDLENSKASVVVAEDEEVKAELEAEVPTRGYFYAKHEASKTTMGRDWTFLNTKGFGKFVGITHVMDSIQSEGNTRGYLEGDERFYMDGIQSPIWHGTGTEDFYEGGWYFNQGVFSNPMNGAPATEAAGMYGTKVQSDSNYRLLIGDAIPFLSAFDGGFEPGPQQDHPASYGATAYWYGHENKAVLRESDRIEIGDEASESAHAYEGDGEVQKMISTFEGKNDKLGINRVRRDSKSDVSFTVKVEEQNKGIRLVRMADQNKSYQEVEVYVDGILVGNWLQVLGNQDHRWLEDSFDIPSYYTEGKEELKIELKQTDGSTHWSASRYIVYSLVSMVGSE